VISQADFCHDPATPDGSKLIPLALRYVLAVAAQKGHSRRHIRRFARNRATATSLEHRP